MLKTGDLVWVWFTTTQWHYAIVQGIEGKDIDVKFFWGFEGPFPRNQVGHFRNDLMKKSQRKLSVSRTRLCTAFFNEPLHKLRTAKCRKLQKILRNHGLTFEPQEWPSPNTRVTIRPDSIYQANGKQTKDRKFEDLLPQWLEAAKLLPSSRDPLGFQAHAEKLANQLLPGLTVFTRRIGYYGFLAWAIQHINNMPCPAGRTSEQQLHRLERALVLCEFVTHDRDDVSCSLIGQRAKLQVLKCHEGNRFWVPKSILKNQATAGALRVYQTSLQSLGFVREVPELGSEGKLPFDLTELGRKLADAFAKRLDDEFPKFALGDGKMHRDTIEGWGQSLCFLAIGQPKAYRKPLLQGFLFCNSDDAAKRYHTARRLFHHKLLTGKYDKPSDQFARAETVNEEDARIMEEDPDKAGLSNARVLLHFYEKKPDDGIRDFQTGAVYELLAIGLAAIFRTVIVELPSCGRLHPGELANRIIGEREFGKPWKTPWFEMAATVTKAHDLVADVLSEDKKPIRWAGVGGLLLARVLACRTFQANANDLGPVASLVEILLNNQARSLADALPELIFAMVEQHLKVSGNKNRQPWCRQDGDSVVKDDVQEMGVGFHSFRFPQLFSLCRDLNLRPEDLTHAD